MFSMQPSSILVRSTRMIIDPGPERSNEIVQTVASDHKYCDGDDFLQPQSRTYQHPSFWSQTRDGQFNRPPRPNHKRPGSKSLSTFPGIQPVDSQTYPSTSPTQRRHTLTFNHRLPLWILGSFSPTLRCCKVAIGVELHRHLASVRYVSVAFFTRNDPFVLVSHIHLSAFLRSLLYSRDLQFSLHQTRLLVVGSSTSRHCNPKHSLSVPHHWPSQTTLVQLKIPISLNFRGQFVVSLKQTKKRGETSAIMGKFPIQPILVPGPYSLNITIIAMLASKNIHVALPLSFCFFFVARGLTTRSLLRLLIDLELGLVQPLDRLDALFPDNRWEELSNVSS